ncbi:MAG: HAD hydrolase family protein [Candidatus Bathyarchaeota archaeon]|nr:HAD hydrolase family protein [Candidatus Bathyarchaeota archaeon]
MTLKPKVFVTDCEGPISKNDNAFELTSSFIPDGDRFFTRVSRYDDVLADVVKKIGYKAGNTLNLILPFLKAYGATNNEMRRYSSKNILLVPGADETLRFVGSIMPSFIVSTSYEHYISALCSAVGFPKENAYCTRLDIDKYEISGEEAQKLKILREEISEMPMIQIPRAAESLDNLPPESQDTVRRLDEIFWQDLPQMDSGKMLNEVNPIGGYEKANAVKEIVERVGVSLSDVIYVGDSITDADPLQLVREGGGLAVSFNGNQYAVREAEIAVLSSHTIVTSVLAEVFSRFGKERVIHLTEIWSPKVLAGFCNSDLVDMLRCLYPDQPPQVERITPSNMEQMIEESSSFRKTVRGEAIAKLG